MITRIEEENIVNYSLSYSFLSKEDNHEKITFTWAGKKNLSPQKATDYAEKLELLKSLYYRRQFPNFRFVYKIYTREVWDTNKNKNIILFLIVPLVGFIITLISYRSELKFRKENGWTSHVSIKKIK